MTIINARYEVKICFSAKDKTPWHFHLPFDMDVSLLAYSMSLCSPSTKNPLSIPISNFVDIKRQFLMLRVSLSSHVLPNILAPASGSFVIPTGSEILIAALICNPKAFERSKQDSSSKQATTVPEIIAHHPFQNILVAD